MRRSGFTIVELLVALSIAILLLGVGSGLAIGPAVSERKMLRTAGKVELLVKQAASKREDCVLILSKSAIQGLGKSIDLGEAQLHYLRPGGKAEWGTPPMSGYRWRFPENGLSESLRLKLSFPEGIVAMDFDPLTGEVTQRVSSVFAD